VESAEESGGEKFGLKLGNEARRQGRSGKETAFFIDRFAIDGPEWTDEQRKRERTTKKRIRTRPAGGGGRA
jgi:hypothetical protein